MASRSARPSKAEATGAKAPGRFAMCLEVRNRPDFDGTQQSFVDCFLEGDVRRLVFRPATGVPIQFSPKLCCCLIDVCESLEPYGYKVTEYYDYSYTIE